MSPLAMIYQIGQPVRTTEDKLVDIAYEVSAKLIPVTVQFRNIKDPEMMLEIAEQQAFGLEINNSTHLANVIRYLEGYSNFNSYHFHIAVKEDVAEEKPPWTKAYHFSDGKLVHAKGFGVQYRAGGLLEEIYDGLPGLIFQGVPEEIKESPLYTGKYIIQSPWTVYAHLVSKNGDVLSNKKGKRLLPLTVDSSRLD